MGRGRDGGGGGRVCFEVYLIPLLHRGGLSGKGCCAGGGVDTSQETTFHANLYQHLYLPTSSSLPVCCKCSGMKVLICSNLHCE